MGLLTAWMVLCGAAVPHLTAIHAAPTGPKEVLNFALFDQRGRLHELRRSGERALVLFFTGNDCPVARLSAAKLRRIDEAYSRRGVRVFLVNSNPGDDRRSLSQEARRLGIWHLAVLKDDTQGVARHLQVRRTGEVLAISTRDWSIFYRGAIDDQLIEGAQKPEPTLRFLENALDLFLEDKPVAVAQTAARGCVITFDAGDAPDSAPVSYSQQVAPILLKNCVGCHSPGNIGAGAMTRYERVKSKAAMIEEVLLSRRMPPWSADPHIGKFANAPDLSLADTRTLLRWIHQGAPRGDGPDPLAAAKVPPAPDWPLGPPDIILSLPEPQQIPATGVLDYRHVEVVATNTADAWIGAVWVKPGNLEVVHHVIARLKERGHKDHLGDQEMYVGWAPGTTQGWFPENSGKFLPAHAKFDFELHYTPNGSPQTDLTQIGLYLLQEKPARRFESVPVVNASFEIRPRDPDSRALATYGFKLPATLHSVTPHMHLRGRWMKFDLLLPNGRRETLCSVQNYDFNWQHTYILAQPRPIPAGAWALLSGGFDNSPANPSNPDPHKAIFWGDQSFDEMFLGWYNVTWELESPPALSAAPPLAP